MQPINQSQPIVGLAKTCQQPGCHNPPVSGCWYCSEHLVLVFAIGDNCPDCGSPLEFDAGDLGSRNQPPIPESMFCANCGSEFGIDWGRQGL